MDKLDAALRFSQEALSLRAHRQEILSANIANADTPNYKARDIDFAATLSNTMSKGGASSVGEVSMARTSARHISGSANSTSFSDEELKYRTPSQSSIDGNTVEMDTERVNFADNAVHYESDLTIISQQIKSMLSAVQP